MVKKNDKVTATAVDYTSSAYAVAKVDRFPLFVKNLMVGEEANLVVTKVFSKYGFAKVLDRKNDSKDRIEPVCPLFPQCGGCQMMQMNSKAQNEFKTNIVRDSIQRIGQLDVDVEPILTMDNPFYYRNKVMVPVSHRPFRAGFYRTHSNDIVDMDVCYIQSLLLNTIYKKVKDFVSENDLTEVQAIILRHGFVSDEVMVALAINQPFNHQGELIQLLKAYEQVKSIQLNIHRDKINTVLSDETITIYGSDTIQDVILGNTFNISLNSFFQVNPIQTEVLYQTAFDLANLESTDTVIDLYSGVGTIGLLLAHHVKRVIGVEVNEQAILDARENARLNHIENIEFVCEDASVFVSNYNDDVDVVFVDPPRKGLTSLGIDDIKRLAPKKLIYISCNPQTLARDLQLLSSDYHIEVVQPVDMFAQTYHVETVVLMSRK